MTANAAEYAEILRADREHVWHHITQHKSMEDSDPFLIVRGEGMRVWDSKGNEYLDAVSGGVWTVNVGYGRTEIADAVRDQLVTLNYFAHTAGNVPAARFASRLIEKMPGLNRVFFSNSGSEANEKAYKIVRQIAHRRHGGQKHKILYRERDYHGTTITALSSTGQSERRAEYGPFTPGFVEFPHCCEYRSQFGAVDDYGERAAYEMERVIQSEGPETVGGVIVEPITAGGGVIPPPQGYCEAIQEICRRYGILLIVDEVVCGLGRTGAWFGYQHYGLEPDIVTMAKGVASGYAAISCTVTTEAVFEAFKEEPEDQMSYFRDISTFGGCTAGPTAALANLEIIEREDLITNARDMGGYLLEQLEAMRTRHELIGDVRGKGLFAGIELVSDRSTKEPLDEKRVIEVAAECQRNGVIVGRTNRSLSGLNNTICLSPGLICTRDDADRIVAALDTAIGRAA